MGNISTTIRGDAQQLIREQDKVAKGAAEVTNEYRELVREGDRLSRSGRRAWDQTRTPLEKYNQRISELNTLLDKGKIDADTHARAIDKARSELDRAKDSAGGFGQSLKSIGTAIGGVSLVSTVISEATKELERLHEAAVEAGEVLKDSFATRGSLAQVATSPADYAFLNRQADLFRSEGGAGTQDLANSITFALRSTGLLEDADTFRALGRTGLVAADDQASFINAIDSIRDALGAQEAGTSRELISKLLVASTATQKGAADIGRAVARAGASGRALGYSDEDVITAVSVLTDPYGSADTAADRLKSLQEQLDKMGIAADSLGGALDTIGQRVTAGETIREVIGDRGEAIDAYRLLQSNRQQFQDLLRQVDQGNTGAALDAKLGLLEGDPVQAALSSQLVNEGRIELFDRTKGAIENARTNFLKTADALNDAAGRNPILRWSDWQVSGGISRLLGAGSLLSSPVTDEGYLSIRRADLEAAGNTRALELLEGLKNAQDELRRVMEEHLTVTKQMQSSTQQRDAPRPQVPQPGA